MRIPKSSGHLFQFYLDIFLAISGDFIARNPYNNSEDCYEGSDYYRKEDIYEKH